MTKNTVKMPHPLVWKIWGNFTLSSKIFSGKLWESTRTNRLQKCQVEICPNGKDRGFIVICKDSLSFRFH